MPDQVDKYPGFRWLVLQAIYTDTAASNIIMISSTSRMGVIEKSLGMSYG